MNVVPNVDPLVQTPPARSRKATLWLVRGAVIIFVAAVSGALWFIRREAKNQVAELSWDLAVQYEGSSQPSIDAKVGPIQFLKDRPGFSITFEQVNYVADGLRLQGRIGNSSLLYVSTLTLNFEATKPLYQFKDEYMKDPSAFFFFLLEPIGKAQAKSIEALNPGTTQPFEATIPNVRQTKDGIRLLVSFSGERYIVGQ